jgi:hypothetical protein
MIVNSIHPTRLASPFIFIIQQLIDVDSLRHSSKQLFTKLQITNDQESPKLELGRGVSKDLFNLAIQWAVCKNIEIDTTCYNNPSTQFDEITSLVLFANSAGVNGLGADMVNHLKPLILKKPSVLRPSTSKPPKDYLHEAQSKSYLRKQ